MEIKIMVVPGKIARIDLVSGMTVLNACEQAERILPGIGWVELAKDREVRVQNRKYSNSAEIPEGYFGTIAGTPLNDGEVVLILTKIKGNGLLDRFRVAPAVLTCTINGQEFALETPVEARLVLTEVAGFDLGEVDYILINGAPADPMQLVGNGDVLEVFLESEEELEPEIEPEPAPETDTITVTINGHTVTGRPENIRRLLA